MSVLRVVCCPQRDFCRDSYLSVFILDGHVTEIDTWRILQGSGDVVVCVVPDPLHESGDQSVKRDQLRCSAGDYAFPAITEELTDPAKSLPTKLAPGVTALGDSKAIPTATSARTK